MAVSVDSLSASYHNAHILVVDDDASIRILLRTFFEKIGYLVTVASNGTEALNFFQQREDEQPFDLVLLDMKMPGMNGLEVCEELRQSSDVPVIVLSGVDEEQIEAEQTAFSKISLGIAGFIQKPFRVHEVESKVQEALNSLSTITPQ